MLVHEKGKVGTDYKFTIYITCIMPMNFRNCTLDSIQSISGTIAMTG